MTGTTVAPMTMSIQLPYLGFELKGISVFLLQLTVEFLDLLVQLINSHRHVVLQSHCYWSILTDM